jgi:hypothetical protein
MKRSVFAAISHKGGTGRSVTMANVAYALALRGKDVCLIDLDLASPTMGSVLEIPELQTGVTKAYDSGNPLSVTDVLEGVLDRDRDREAEEIEGALVNVWRRSECFNGEQPARAGSFFFLPGRRWQGDKFDAHDMAPILDQILGVIARKYDIIICDLRSGLSEPFQAFFDGRLSKRLAAFVFHYRWTPQQLNGLSEMLSPEVMSRISTDRVRFVRTAVMDADSYEAFSSFGKWVGDSSRKLEARLSELNTPIDISDQELLLGQVPIEPVLQWRETIITPRLVGDGIAQRATVDAFESIAAAMIELTEDDET